jgi:hypothetical protein
MMQHNFWLDPPRAQSREITPQWEVSKPQSCAYAAQGNRVQVTFQIEGEQNTEHARMKAHINATRNESRKMEGQRVFILLI